jgi:hypothetical protein
MGDSSIFTLMFLGGLPIVIGKYKILRWVKSNIREPVGSSSVLMDTGKPKRPIE